MKFVDPLTDLGPRLLEVEKPVRYTGGEYGSLAGATMNGASLRAAIIFPDLYEIGMSNQAFRILYNGLNSAGDAGAGISCDRAFAPAPDFEKLLGETGIPLYGLDTGIALYQCDLLLVTLGYELGITGFLSVLETSRIALRSADRGEGDPIVIMGGPCVSNPLPYSAFVDAFWIGEAEAGFFDLCRRLAALKKAGAARSDLLARLVEHPSVWTRGKAGPVRRAVYPRFGAEQSAAAVFPVPSFSVVQHHGAVEIMRGCPNGCRFCHAGVWYRPMRQKRADLVMRETDDFIRLGGYREVSLSSLSSGDYCRLDELISALNLRYGGRHISFQLPSLRVSGFSLSLLGGISEVRKSGLTFAVETPRDMDQLSLNKQVGLEEVSAILAEARRQGWRGAKFYFMVGLPIAGGENEAEAICGFVNEAAKRTRTHFNVNVGVFVPKPHTPYQWAAQLDEETARQKLHAIQNALKPRGHKVGVHDPFTAQLEGLISRGDERVGGLIETAFRRGCRLDGWSDFIRRDIWRELFAANAGLVTEALRPKALDEKLPWDIIESGTDKRHLAEEYENSRAGKSSAPCMEKCTNFCGLCGNDIKVVRNFIQAANKSVMGGEIEPAAGGQGVSAQNDLPRSETFDTASNKKPAYRMLFSYAKLGKAVFVSHLGVNEVFSMAFTRSQMPLVYTRGFNPLIRLEIASPVSIGISCRGEIASADLESVVAPDEFTRRLNTLLPEGFAITGAALYEIPFGAKKHSLASLLWGFRYRGEYVAFRDDKEYRSSRAVYGLQRDEVLAKHPGDQSAHTGYFGAYDFLYNPVI
ncbi:MAG: TIGR03936 family radical SAM-associated protein [Treponema sp.]|jgi:radical SAM superfamily enzyme YgiQ (UPF0313 family)|nr:TIGR03936 family radical SAM-associated protein [Treponema sp.]